jgi:hypothetical protein
MNEQLPKLIAALETVDTAPAASAPPSASLESTIFDSAARGTLAHGITARWPAECFDPGTRDRGIEARAK